MRLFISIDPPRNIQQSLHRHLACTHPVKWTKLDQIHLTLAFLGEQPGFAVPKLSAALSQIRFSPFQLTTDKVNHFRNGAIWMGIKPNEALEQLHREIKQTLEKAGFSEPDNRPFTPHITLCSHKGDSRSAAEELNLAFEEGELSFTVDRFQLKRSVLQQDGAIHNIEAEFRS
ncbi:RNA 2',3'-cyclic phosphodiesterase [Marinobacterium jannaschii]|uniref:RNA 2',3'-cyclic phosphodiesterase n=1 Tax=Marinobacterium jannaschii TaxID=64970 RepID=UPI000685DC4F|nr:RNA 2',3'-cyclic phosphodiesterase [Marinobacterium jannaschii]